ncbi:hypothetical protein L1887_52676 [Cichorium endivia]|nr:hypothetical protein L1887_52676 [Cichorium endivia]
MGGLSYFAGAGSSERHPERIARARVGIRVCGRWPSDRATTLPDAGSRGPASLALILFSDSLLAQKQSQDYFLPAPRAGYADVTDILDFVDHMSRQIGHNTRRGEAGAVFNESPYKGYNENTTAVPLISYEGDSFYVRQTTGGWILWKDAKNELSLTASWMPLHFDPDDNDDHQMKKLDERKASAFPRRRVLPPRKLGDESYNDYYYGVSGSESRRSGLDEYTAGDSWTPYVGLAAKYQLTQKLYLNASAVYTVLPDDVKNSPMIDRDDSFALMTGLTWRF